MVLIITFEENLVLITSIIRFYFITQELAWLTLGVRALCKMISLTK